MNKYIILIIIGAFIVGGGLAYRVFLPPKEAKPVVTGAVREITIIAKKNEWRFQPEEVEINRGDKVIATVINEDDYDHGIAIDAFGVSQRIPAKSAVKIEFTATQEGDFPFYCSVPRGEGEIEGHKRGHFDMAGKIHVRSNLSEAG